MNIEDLEAIFEKHNDEFLKFGNIENKFSNRPDLHAFILLDRLLPSNRDIICAGEHDEIWLEIDCEKLAEVITEEQIKDLIRCGIRYDNGLCMFV